MARAELGRAAPVRSTPSPSQACVCGASLALCPAGTYRRGQEQGLSGPRKRSSASSQLQHPGQVPTGTTAARMSALGGKTPVITKGSARAQWTWPCVASTPHAALAPGSPRLNNSHTAFPAGPVPDWLPSQALGHEDSLRMSSLLTAQSPPSGFPSPPHRPSPPPLSLGTGI